MSRKLGLIAALLATAWTSCAMAQDVVVMRRTVAPARIQDAPSHAPGTWMVGDPVVTPGCSASQPTQAPVSCVDGSGNTVAESRCAGTRPTGTGTTADYSACEYRWSTGQYGTFNPSCSTEATRTRTVTCIRQDAALTPVDAGMCDPNSPDARTVEGPLANYAGCTYTAGGWTQGAPSSTCSATATRQETATTCTRSGGQVPSTATIQECVSAGVATTRTSAAYAETSGCTYTGTYSTTYGACSGGKQTAPIVSCKRSDGTTVANSFCAPTTEKACSVRCESFASSRWTGKFINGNTQVRTHSMAAPTLAQAQTACASLASTYGVGACFWAQNNASVVFYEQYAWITFANRSDLYGANCGQ